MKEFILLLLLAFISITPLLVNEVMMFRANHYFLSRINTLPSNGSVW